MCHKFSPRIHTIIRSNFNCYLVPSYENIKTIPIIKYSSLYFHYKIISKKKLNRIKAVLLEKGISQTWLAKKLDKSFSMVNAYACNRIQSNLKTLQEIAGILQVDLKDLITDKKDR